MFLKRIEKGWLFNYGIFEATKLEEVEWNFPMALSYRTRTFFVEAGERIRIRLKKSDKTDLFEVGDTISLYNLMDKSNYEQFRWYPGTRK